MDYKSSFINHKIHLIIEKTVEQTFNLKIVYNQSNFEDNQLLSRLQHLIQQVIESNNKQINDLSILLPNELDARDIGKPNEQTIESIVQPFENQVQLTPTNLAIIQNKQSIHYAELNLKANQLAHYLIKKQIKQNKIGLFMHRQIDVITVILAILKSGNSYLPLDPNYPEDRLKFMIDDSQIKVIICHDSLPITLQNDDSLIINYLAENFTEENTQNPELATTENAITYTIYTSGSTGQPKATSIYQKSVINLLQWYQQCFQLQTTDQLLVISSISFDLTQKNLLTPLWSGATIVFPQHSEFDLLDIQQTLQNNNITLINCAPSMFYPLLNLSDHDLTEFSNLRYLIFGGESIQLNQCQTLLNNAQFKGQIVNSYGPTECTDIASYYKIADPTQFSQSAIPIGKAINQVNLYVVDRFNQCLPRGFIGELCIGGISVGTGYLNNSTLNDKVFIDEIGRSEKSSKMYKTGDLVSMNDASELYYFGRMDSQIKLHGLRIELGEIESLISQCQLIKSSAIQVIDDQLIGYIVTGNTQDSSIEIAIKDELSKRVPAYMVPSQFIMLDKLPLTPSGKLDRKALPKPSIQSSDHFQTPNNQIESTLCQQWQQLLQVKDICTHASFFDMGGHSLLATQAIARIRQHFEIELPLTQLFKNDNITSLAKVIDDLIKQPGKIKTQGNIVTVSRNQPLPLSFSQSRLWWLNRLDPDNSAYNIHVTLELLDDVNSEHIDKTLLEIVRRHEILRTSYHSVNEQTQQIINPVDCFSLKNKTFQGDIQPIIQQELKRCFKQNSQTFFRATLLSKPHDQAELSSSSTRTELKSSRHKTYLMLTFHHSIADGWSMALFQQEFISIYEAYSNNKTSPLQELTIQYADYASWQRQLIQGNSLKQQLTFWKNHCQDIEILNLPHDYPRPSQMRYQGSSCQKQFEISQWSLFESHCKQYQVTPFMFLLAS
ncbi:MAG: amino acid adenylation domain-containing protein, partial [Methylococcales bacterium]|nr:amino acid adenylation domain-containing protein [Methylococcales bacterium]